MGGTVATFAARMAIIDISKVRPLRCAFDHASGKCGTRVPSCLWSSMSTPGKHSVLRSRGGENDLRAHPCYPATTFPQPASAMTPRLNRYRPAVIFAMLAAGASADSARADDIVLKDAASMAGAGAWLSARAPRPVAAGGAGGRLRAPAVA